MADLVHESSILTQDFADLEASEFGLADVKFLDQHFIDPRGPHGTGAQLLSAQPG